MTIKPHSLFDIWRADEVAECLDGVTTELYIALWSKIVPIQKKLTNIEDSGPHDHIGVACLSLYWDRLTPEEQTQLNALAATFDKEMDKVLGKEPREDEV